MTEAFPQIRAAAIDGRAHNTYYRQTQLEGLCQGLTNNVAKIREAIATDYGHTQAEIAVEVNLAVSAIRRDYASLQPKQAHLDEYLIAAGEDAPSGRRPAGIVYIEPCTHTLLYSVIVPLSAAIAAGNCVIVLLENNLRAVSSLLRRILSDALDRDTFAIASSPVREESLLTSVINVKQQNGERWPRANQVSSPSQSRTVAVVDRTGNVELAARELLAARFSFGGRSSYAPDIIFVNEFSRQAFLQSVVAECVKLGNGIPRNGAAAKGKSTAASKVNDTIDTLRKENPELRVVVQESKFAVVEVTSRNNELLAQKTNVPVMIVHAFRSLDDAIDLINSTKNDTPALAAYHFSNSASGKYLTQFVDAAVSFVNNVPREILVGPAFPAARPIDMSARYPLRLFTEARPAFIQPTVASTLLSTALASHNNPTVQKLMAEAAAPLAAMKRHPGGGVGFFEQGFLMSAALLLTTTISVASGGMYWYIRHGRSL